MPENFSMAKCPKAGTCEWDRTKWMTQVYPPSTEAILAAQKHGAQIGDATGPRHNKRDVGLGAGSDDEKEEEEPPQRKESGLKTPAGPSGPTPAGAVGDADADEITNRKTGTHVHLDPEMNEKEEKEEKEEKDEQPTPVADGVQEPAPYHAPPMKDEYELWLQTIEGQLKNTGLPEGYTAVGDSRYILRPEAIESVFYMYRITGDRSWQDKGWKMFQAIEKFTKTEIAHSAIGSVLDASGAYKLDSMESFWLAETLKYFYLLFSEPNVISLDDFVLNTEAHPLQRPKPKSA
ncbi:hypothetical protein ABW21_db0201638 [Orbilia brochopaga]|nr:hypothetical protein ABW21_db0201638 [Drechslerella brochopaga]